MGYEGNAAKIKICRRNVSAYIATGHRSFHRATRGRQNFNIEIGGTYLIHLLKTNKLTSHTTNNGRPLKYNAPPSVFVLFQESNEQKKQW